MRDYCVAKNVTHRATHLDPSPRKKRLLGMTAKLAHYWSGLHVKRVAIPAVYSCRFNIAETALQQE